MNVKFIVEKYHFNYNNSAKERTSKNTIFFVMLFDEYKEEKSEEKES